MNDLPLYVLPEPVLYAHDTTLISRTGDLNDVIDSLSLMLDKAGEWFSTNGLLVTQTDTTNDIWL